MNLFLGSLKLSWSYLSFPDRPILPKTLAFTPTPEIINY